MIIIIKLCVFVRSWRNEAAVSQQMISGRSAVHMAAVHFAVSSLSWDELVCSLWLFSGVRGPPHHSCSWGRCQALHAQWSLSSCCKAGRTWMHLYLMISRGCCLGELSGASYSECGGTGQLPENSEMVETKRWLHELVWLQRSNWGNSKRE